MQSISVRHGWFRRWLSVGMLCCLLIPNLDFRVLYTVAREYTFETDVLSGGALLLSVSDTLRIPNGQTMYEDEAYGFSILIPTEATVTPASGNLGSQTNILLENPEDKTDKVSISFGRFVVGKPPSVTIAEWVRPSQNMASDLVEEQYTKDLAPFVYTQTYFGNQDGEFRSILRAYIHYEENVYFADFEPSSSVWGYQLFKGILNTWEFGQGSEITHQTIVPTVYNYTYEHPQKNALVASSLPEGYSLPTLGNRPITQDGDDCGSHCCPNGFDCGAIDIDVQENYRSDLAHLDEPFDIDPIFAPADGYLELLQEPYGNTAKIVHSNGATTYLGHLKEFSLSSGSVSKGDMVGVGGNTGPYSQGSHLHWIVRPSSDTHTGHIDIVGVQGLDLQTKMAHGAIVLNDIGYLPIQESNAVAFYSDQESLPFYLQYPYDIRIGKWWSTILFKEPNYQGEWQYYGPGTAYPNKPIPVQSMRVYYQVCPLPPSAASTHNVSMTENAYPDCDLNPSPSIYDHATFLSETIPDGTKLSPGQSFIKTWTVRNSGTSTWGDGYELVHIGGSRFGAPAVVDIENVAPGGVIDISVDMVAPTEGGLQRSTWNLRNAQGTQFQDFYLYAEIEVPDGSVPTPPPPSGGGAAIELDRIDNLFVVPPGHHFRPVIRATVNSGDLIQSRGDMLLHKGGENYVYEGFPHIEVVGNHYVGSTYDFQFYENNPFVAPTAEGNYETTYQVWRNGNWVGDEITIRFQVRQGGTLNHAPNPPTLTGPGDWAVFQGEAVALSAQPNGDPDGDAVTECYFDLRGASPTNSGWVPCGTWTATGLPFNGYEWQVKVRDSEGNESDWSEQTWHFSVLNNDPEIYDFHWEMCRDAWGGSEKVCFCASTNAGTLKVQINTASDGSTNGEWRGINELGVPEYRCESDDDRPPNLDPLPYESGTHVVRLYARRDGGWENAAYQDITLSLPADRKPNSPSLRQPLWRTYVNSLGVHLDWDETLRTNSYRLEVSDTSDYSNLLVDQTFAAGATEYDHTFATDYETVYWRVTASGPYGSNTGNGEFYIDLDAPTSGMTSLPPVTFDTKFTVNWGGSDERSGLRWYHVQMRDASRPDGAWEDWLVNTTKTAEMFQGQPGHTYAFRVRAMDDIGNWEDWPAGENGDTHTQVDPASAPQTAWWDVNYIQKRNLVILNNDGDTMPADFPVHIHFDASTTPSAGEIYNASLSATKGDDVRVVYDNQTEVHRFVQRFTAEQIDLWFPLQGGLGGGQTDSDSYQIYYGYAGASNPPADVNTVFLPKTDANTMGLWHFQDGSGSAVNDNSGRSHNGSFANGGWSDGFLSTAGSFNGSNSAVELGHHADFDNLGAMTLEMWLYPMRSGWGIPLVKGIDGYGQFTIRINGDSQVEFTVGADGGNQSVVSNVHLQTNQWYHIAAVHDGGSNQWIYVNGVKEGEKTDSHTPVMRDYSLYIGNAPWWDGMAFQGLIQHVRILNVARHDFSYARVNISPSVEAGVPIAQPSSGAPDLAILNLATYPNPGGGLLVAALVENQGDAPTLNNFYTDLYVDHLPTGSGDYAGSLQFWVNSPIAAGAQLTLTTVVTDLGSLGGSLARALAEPGGEVTAMLYSQVDSAGVISETDNANNISSGVEFCLASADAYEGDDELVNASVITAFQTQSHNFGGPADRDWVQFTAQGGVTYTIRTLGLGSGADTYLYLYDTDGTTLLAANDDYGGSLASRIDWTAPVTGTYYLLVQHWNPNVGGCGTGYNLSLIDTSQVQTIFLPLVLRGYGAP